ncbi:MAG TPA: tetratricopeptide repeat protein [Bacteroidales bacterium]|nr:tetratricopeptide repeat protein [Bacteroidales bacterium]
MKNNITKHINKYFLIFAFVFMLISVFSYSQEERRTIREGNKFYNDKDYDNAELNYNKALKINPDTKELYNNIGTSQYRNGKFTEAATNYENFLKFTGNRKEKADAFYNIGNSYLQAAEYDKSIQAYKNALKLDPTHDLSRYNMAVATKIKESGGSGQNQQQQQQDNQDQQDKKDQNKDNKNDQKDKGDQNENKDQENKDKQQDKKPQPKDNEMSREEMEQFLESLQQKEKDVQDKVKKEKFQIQQRVVEKEW